MPLLYRVNPISQPKNPTKDSPSHQRELSLTSETIIHALPKEVTAEYRQLIGQLLRPVLLAEMEVRDEQRIKKITPPGLDPSHYRANCTHAPVARASWGL